MKILFQYGYISMSTSLWHLDDRPMRNGPICALCRFLTLHCCFIYPYFLLCQTTSFTFPPEVRCLLAVIILFFRSSFVLGQLISMLQLKGISLTFLSQWVRTMVVLLLNRLTGPMFLLGLHRHLGVYTGFVAHFS